MILLTETLFAMRCPSCGKLEFHPLSIFAFSGNRTVKLLCSCGNSKIIIGSKHYKKFWVQLPCVLCETKHLLYYDFKQIWSSKVTYMLCTDTNLELGFFGPPEQVREIAESQSNNIDNIIDELGYDDYFHNPEVMMEALNCLHDIAEDGMLYCGCGNYNIEVDIFPDRLELQCKECNSVSIVYAETEEDLKVIKGVDRIELDYKGFKCLDGVSNNNKKNKRNKRNWDNNNKN
jgi:hypothetical protein